MGVDDDVGGMQGFGVVEHGRIDTGGKSVQRDEGDNGQGHTQYKDDRLAARACDLSDDEMSMQKSIVHVSASGRLGAPHRQIIVDVD